MPYFLHSLTTSALREAAEVKEQIENLTSRLGELLGTTGSQPQNGRAKGRKGKFSAKALAKMRASQKARWAKKKAVAGEVTEIPKRRQKRKISPEGRARIAAAQRKRWAAVKRKAGKS